MLRKKLLRDLHENKGAYIACIIIITIGLMVFTSFSMVIDNLTLSQNKFYASQNFADGFAEVKAMPRREVEKLEQIKGIDQVQGRLVQDVRVLSPEREENVYLRFVSYDPSQASHINDVMLERGIALDNDKKNIWLDNKFFAANHLELNQEIEVVINGSRRELHVVGTGRSPEFIYAMRTSSDLFPSPETFGIAYIPTGVMENLFSARTVNDIVFTLHPGTDYKDVKNEIKTELEPYGLEKLYPRKDQTSHMLLTQELKGLESMVQTLPVLFLAVAAMILYIMLKRLVEHQRGQIGVLKAFGYTNREIVYHYLSYALVTGIAGGITGGLLGIALSFPFTSMYQEYFNMPGLSSKFSPVYLLTSVLLSIAFAAFAGFQGCKGVLALKPAEAMNPPAPPAGKKIWLEKISFFWNMLTVQGMMATRNIIRNKGRSLFIFLGIMFTFALLGLTWSFQDLTMQMLFDQYQKVETYDVKVSLAGPRDGEEVEREFRHFSGVNRVETMAEVPVTLHNQWHKKDVVLLGLPGDSRLYNIMNKNNHQVKLPRDGILLSQRLSRLLNAEPGTRLTLDSVMLGDGEEERKVEVAGIIPQYLGINAYMEIGALQDLLGEGAIATSALLKMERGKIPELEEEYNKSAAVSGIDRRAERLRQSEEMMGSFTGMIFILALIGIITGFAIIYNSSVITLSERSHELASMMVLGMTPAEVLSVITFEQWFIGVFAMIAGIPATQLLLAGISQSMSNDVYTMPADMTANSVLIAFVVTAASIWIAQKAASRKINRLSLVEALKSRE